MRVKAENRLPRQYDLASLAKLFRDFETQLNSLSEGYVQAATNAATAAPTTGTYQKGDFIRHSAPAVTGTPGQIVIGYVCTAAGTPGTWKEVRVLVGAAVTPTEQIFTSGSGTYTTPAGATWIEVHGWAGGASGAAGNTSTSTRGSGGGAGGYFRKRIVGPAATYSYAVGAAGAGVTATAGGADGNNGGDTTFSTLTATKGSKGVNGSAAGGGGGGATGGDENITGQSGQVGQNGGATAAVAAGGSSPRGGQGGASNVGDAGTVPGGGGSCGNHTGGAVSGPGAAGKIVVIEHYT